MAQSLEARMTPLASEHHALGARMVEFGGWQMPLSYAGILEEHRAVRSRAGLFDLSHMGELFIEGPEAAAALGYALTTNPSALAVGRAHYSMICFPWGGVMDDLIVYRLGQDRFMVVANASNAPAVSDALAERIEGFEVILDDRSLATGLVAIQGPLSVQILRPLTDVDLAAQRYYSIAEGHVAGVPALVARTGYTGEDGFEVFAEVSLISRVWTAMLEGGRGRGLVPVGLGARDTLRLEAGMPLYGNELGPDTTPFEAGLGRVVKFEKGGDFVGREALEKAQADGPRRRLVGLVVRGRGIARHGYDVFAGESKTGVVTSGTLSPTLNEPIAMAYVAPSSSEPGTIVDVGVRDQKVPSEIVPLPFYKRPT
jgi:aminomethyltransferase